MCSEIIPGGAGEIEDMQCWGIQLISVLYKVSALFLSPTLLITVYNLFDA